MFIYDFSSVILTIFYRKPQKSQKYPSEMVKKKHSCPREHHGAFFVHVPDILGHALRQKVGCYQKILGSPLFVAEFTGLLLKMPYLLKLNHEKTSKLDVDPPD